MRLSNSEENHINNANARLRGIVFSSQSICENGNFETAGVVQTVSISNHVNNTTYPHRKCYDIKIERSYSNISPYQTQALSSADQLRQKKPRRQNNNKARLSIRR